MVATNETQGRIYGVDATGKGLGKTSSSKFWANWAMPGGCWLDASVPEELESKDGSGGKRKSVHCRDFPFGHVQLTANDDNINDNNINNTKHHRQRFCILIRPLSLAVFGRVASSRSRAVFPQPPVVVQ